MFSAAMTNSTSLSPDHQPQDKKKIRLPGNPGAIHQYNVAGLAHVSSHVPSEFLATWQKSDGQTSDFLDLTAADHVNGHRGNGGCSGFTEAAAASNTWGDCEGERKRERELGGLKG
ncbi:hypothetical protein TIFTF001_038397 [Ficus carica]|uniref:Uncharacterized protein n=1 Tax=Ficus carica TaxID=3494 RepID=A0AA88E8Q5_FICCA|nr:hypothetical protein TIFTF001_038397 [Ficus carica]